MTTAEPDLAPRVRAYWDAHVHDVAITAQPVGTPAFFRDLDEYHFEKLHHLPALVDFERQRGRRVLDVGCGAGVDLVRFAQAGADVTGVDVSWRAIDLARRNAALNAPRPVRLAVADGEALPFPAGSFDYVFAHGILQYTANEQSLIGEVRRVLAPGGTAFFQAYNRWSWLNALSALTKVDLEHTDAPVLRKHTPRELEALLGGFREVTLVTERFPVATRLHRGWKGTLYNRVFVGLFNAVPRVLTRRLGWHLLAICRA